MCFLRETFCVKVSPQCSQLLSVSHVCINMCLLRASLFANCLPHSEHSRAMAAEWWKLERITDHSGHYKQSLQYTPFMTISCSVNLDAKNCSLKTWGKLCLLLTLELHATSTSKPMFPDVYIFPEIPWSKLKDRNTVTCLLFLRPSAQIQTQ